jgi:hypothetical protein
MPDSLTILCIGQQGDRSMRRLLFSIAALGGLTAMTAFGAAAAPPAGMHMAPPQPQASRVDFYHNHHHWHHRHWENHHWRYWD